MKPEIKVMFKIFLLLILLSIVFGFILPIFVSSTDDFMVIAGFLLLGISIIALYILGRYWIYTDLKQIIQGVNDDQKVHEDTNPRN